MHSWRPGAPPQWLSAVSAMCLTRLWLTTISIHAPLARPASNQHLLLARNGRLDWHPLSKCNQASWPIKAKIRSLQQMCMDANARQSAASVLTFRTPIRSYAVIGQMGLGVPAGNEKLAVTHTRRAFILGRIECVNTTSIWLASLNASEERKTPAPKAKNKAG